VDLSARLGDAQFVSVLTGADALEALAFVERVRSAFAKEPFPWGPVTLSAGIAYHARGIGSPDALLAEADRMLHRALAAGPGEVVLWEPGSRARALLAVAGLEGDAEAEAEPLEPVPTIAGEEARGRVLVVEDGFDTLGPAARMATRLGFEVDGVMDGRAAIERLTNHPADIVLAPLVMPEMAGFTLADRIAHEHPGTPVLLVSAYEHDALAHERRPASLVGFVRRPVEVRDLGVMLERALAEARAAAQGRRRVESMRVG
jgi:PleD family two-component response regulator